MLQNLYKQYPPHLRHVTTLPWQIRNLRIFCRYSAHMEENANCIFIASNSVIHPQILIFLVFKIPRFPHTDCNKNFSCRCSFTCLPFAINLCQRKFVTADVAALFVNSEHGIQWREYFDKNTYIHSAYTVTHAEELKSVHLNCNLFALSSISAEYLQKIECLISQGSVAICLRWGE